MDYYGLANVLTGVVLVASAVAPLVMAHKVNIKKIRNLTYMLALFLVLHGFYHIQIFTGQAFPPATVIGTTSVIVMIFFAIYLYRMTFPSTSTPSKGEVASIATAATTTPSTVAAIIITPAQIEGSISLAGLLISLGLLIFMAYKHPSIRSLHFQFAVALSIWVVSEIDYYMELLGITNLFPYPQVGIWIHFVSMAALGIFVNYRTFGFFKAARHLRIELGVKGRIAD
jgi:hypothetical protein